MAAPKTLLNDLKVLAKARRHYVDVAEKFEKKTGIGVCALSEDIQMRDLRDLPGESIGIKCDHVIHDMIFTEYPIRKSIVVDGTYLFSIGDYSSLDIPEE